MESKETAARQLRDLERAEAAPYLDYPPTPAWYAPAVGAWTTGMFVAVFSLLARRDNALWVQVTLVVLIAVEVLFLRWYSRFHGAMPALGRAPKPREISAVYTRFLGGFVVVAALVTAASFLGMVAGALATFVLVTIGLVVYERAYAAAARAARERLA